MRNSWCRKTQHDVESNIFVRASVAGSDFIIMENNKNRVFSLYDFHVEYAWLCLGYISCSVFYVYALSWKKRAGRIIVADD